MNQNTSRAHSFNGNTLKSLVEKLKWKHSVTKAFAMLHNASNENKDWEGHCKEKVFNHFFLNFLVRLPIRVTVLS